MEILLNYGSGEVSLALPGSAREISHREPQMGVDHDRFKRDLHSYLYSINRPVKSAGIVVSDKTRLCQFPLFLPLVTEALMAYGVKRDEITFYIAYGTHARQSEKESLESYGEIYREFRFVHHNSRDESQLVLVGTTSRGTDIRVNRAILEHDLLVTFGAILHHYFAGYGGGRKLLFPGLGGYESVLQNHSLFLDFEKQRLQPGCQSGVLDDNPLALDLEEVGEMLPGRLEIHAILNSQKEVCEISFGSGYDHFRKACARYDDHFRIGDGGSGDRLFDETVDGSVYDLVVASAGGYPRDINYIQAHKAIHNAASFVKDGGRLVIFAECLDGIGNPDFLELFGPEGSEGIFAAMERGYRNNAGTALATLEKSARIDIRFVTSLDEEACSLMGMVKTSGEEAGKIIQGEKGGVAWIANASLLYR
ncbi:MAG: lactate racemase domain-containing protein [Bacteroidota bacterium]